MGFYKTWGEKLLRSFSWNRPTETFVDSMRNATYPCWTTVNPRPNAPSLFEKLARKEVRTTLLIFATEALRKERERIGLSMTGLAEAARISTVFYSDIENGRKSCSEKTMLSICKVIDENTPKQGADY